MQYPPAFKYRFRSGPYLPPPATKGAILFDEWRREEVEVGGMTKAPIPWPGIEYNVGRHAGLLPILCGDLVRAVVEEPQGVVAHYFGVSKHVVNLWRKALAGADASAEVHAKLAVKRFDPDFRKAHGYK